MSTLESIRMDKKISLEAASKAIHVSRKTLRRWETNPATSPIRHVQLLAAVYGIHPIEFFIPPVEPFFFPYDE